MIYPELDALIQQFRLPRLNDSYDFSRVTNEQYIAFRHAFVEERMFNPTYRANKGSQAMDLLLSVICMVLCNRVPKGLVPFRTDQLISKIRMVHAPKNVEFMRRTLVERVPVSVENPTGEKHTVIEKNTNERAVVRILVPKRTMTLSEYEREQKHDDEEAAKDAASRASPDGKEDENKAEGGRASASPDEGAAKDADKSAANISAARSQQQSRLSRVPSEKIVE